MKAFPKTPRKVLSVVIDEHGQLEYLKTDSCDVLLELGETVTRRASHVEPATFWTRVWFHVVRRFVTDKSAIASWTRGWRCQWRVNCSPVGGPILLWKHIPANGLDMRHTVWANEIATWSNRQHAIDAEVAFLNEFFLTR